jgi:23S rRNA pseudoU1915 N3-methylase RlmH
MVGEEGSGGIHFGGGGLGGLWARLENRCSSGLEMGRLTLIHPVLNVIHWECVGPAGAVL